MAKIRPPLLAFLIGALLVFAVPVLLALVAAVPGLRTLVGSIKSAELPLQPAYFALTNLLPAMLLSFAVGLIMFRALNGWRPGLFFASVAPWLLQSLEAYLDLCVGSPVSCTGAYDIAGLVVVPLGLLLAAFVPRPPSLDMPIDTDPQQQAAASPQVVVVRPSSR